MNTSEFEITFLGTCAHDFSPKLKAEYKDKFDNDARRASALLINDSLLIDSGLHILNSLSIIGKSLNEITDIFLTHLHIDHFYLPNIAEIAGSKQEALRVWVREDAEIECPKNVTLIRMKLFEKYDIGNGITIVGMPANHAPTVFPQHFIFEKHGKKFFYGCDGGWFLNQTFNYLKNTELELMVLDCTVGDYIGDFRMGEHNSIPMIRLMLPSLRTIKAINDHSRIILSHIAPSLHKTHAETVAIAKEFGAEIAFDGFKVTV
ncbi:MAG: MBL fold metallo-hydrolase [Clostridia bacterium]|nr:MBL fold metallo-hydrolase [Clostridia bacterium]